MTTTYEVEADLSWDQVGPRSKVTNDRNNTGAKGRRPMTIDRVTLEDFHDDYTFYRNLGWTNSQIRHALNLHEDTFVTRLARLHLSSIEETPGIRRNRAILDRLIESGEPFHAEQLPEGDDESTNMHLISAASRAGRIQRVGKKVAKNGANIAIWQSSTTIRETV